MWRIAPARPGNPQPSLAHAPHPPDNRATELVARSEPDGHTLLLATFTGPVNETLFKNFKYKAADSFEPIASMVETGLVLLVHPSLDVKNVQELVALAKAKPGEILYATAGKG